MAPPCLFFMACLAFHSYRLPSTWKMVNIAWLKCLKLLRGEYCLKSVVMSPQRCRASVQERAGVRARLLRYSVITANISSILAHLPVSLSPTPVRLRWVPDMVQYQHHRDMERCSLEYTACTVFLFLWMKQKTWPPSSASWLGLTTYGSHYWWFTETYCLLQSINWDNGETTHFSCKS